MDKDCRFSNHADSAGDRNLQNRERAVSRLRGTQPPEPLLGSEPLDSREESQYQPRFLPRDRAGKPQNLPRDLGPLQLFQLFFIVKEIEVIVKHTNYQAAYIGLIVT
jgi:hypothetical protein